MSNANEIARAQANHQWERNQQRREAEDLARADDLGECYECEETIAQYPLMREVWRFVGATSVTEVQSHLGCWIKSFTNVEASNSAFEDLAYYRAILETGGEE